MKRNRQNDKLVVKIIENETCKMITWENDKKFPARIIKCETCKMISWRRKNKKVTDYD